MLTAEAAYRMALSLQARRVVQVGFQPAVSRALARAVHHQARGRGGLLITSALDARDLHATRRMLSGTLRQYLLPRAGDARRTLCAFDGPFDLLWLACPSDVAAQVAQLLRPKLAPHALVQHAHGAHDIDAA